MAKPFTVIDSYKSMKKSRASSAIRENIQHSGEFPGRGNIIRIADADFEIVVDRENRTFSFVESGTTNPATIVDFPVSRRDQLIKAIKKVIDTIEW